MPERSKHLEKAEKAVQKGKLGDALEEYLLAWKEEPNNDNLVEIISELYHRQGQPAKSQECLSYLLDKYKERGDSAKTVLVFRKMLKLGPQEPGRLLDFARLLEKSKPEEAREHYREASQLFLEQGAKAKAVEALIPLAALDPSNVDLQCRLGDVAQEVGQKEVASAAFLRAAELRQTQGVAKSAQALLERAHELLPQDVNITMRLAAALSQAGEPARTIALLAPLASSGTEAGRNAGPTSAMLRLLGEAYLATADFPNAEPVLWQLAASTPEAHALLFRVVEGHLAAGQQSRAAASLEKLKRAMFQAGRNREFVEMAEGIARKDTAGIDIIEFLAALYNELNYDSQLHVCLERLFDLYFAEGNFLKSADALERMVDVDPYDAGNSQRLGRLNGKIDTRRWQAIAGRFQQTTVSASAGGAGAGSGTGPAGAGTVAEGEAAGGEESNVLEDLILQAEIFLQYGLRPRAIERLERIRKLFPGEEEKNDKLRSLYNMGGMRVAAAAHAAPAKTGEAEDTVDETATDVTRVTEITRNIYRQGTVKGVLFAAVNDIGRNWRVNRCVAGLCSPGKSPSALLEYCSTGTKQSDVMSIVKLLIGIQRLTGDGRPLAIEDVESSAKVAPLGPVLKAQGVRSLLALPLMDSDQHQGALILEQDRRRRWRPNEIAVLESIANQMVMTTSHVRLRSLVKSLAVTDERTGMLNRSSYTDCLLSEVARAQKQGGTVCVLLWQFGRGNQLVREHGEEAVRKFVDEAGQVIMSHLRQNDVAIKYDPTTVALVCPDTKSQDIFFVVEKMRKLLAGVRLADGSTPTSPVGIAEAIIEADGAMDAVDSVTELINRAEEALAAAQKETGNAGKLLAPPALAAAT